MAYEDLSRFISRFNEEISNNKTQRKGQLAFNILYRMYPEVANQIRMTQYDPFYHDKRLPIFFEEVTKKLIEK